MDKKRSTIPLFSEESLTGAVSDAGVASLAGTISLKRSWDSKEESGWKIGVGAVWGGEKR